MIKSVSISVLLMTLLVGSGNVLTMERGVFAGRTNVTACVMPTLCNMHGFTNWYEVGSVCVKYFSTPLNFTAAEFRCRTKAPGAHLVSVHSEKHNDYLLCIVKKFNPKNLRFWLGAFEFYKSGTFFWLDGSNWDFQFWASGEPNHMYTSTEECVEMNWNSSDGRWNDDTCRAEKNYICAFKANAILKPGSEEME